MFDDGLNVVSEKELQDDYSDMLVIGSSAYLLGYNTVQKVESYLIKEAVYGIAVCDSL